jgi:hypothetical protein
MNSLREHYGMPGTSSDEAGRLIRAVLDVRR